jgi:hypothetical protein
MGRKGLTVIDSYEIRRRIDDFKYRLSGAPRGLVIGVLAAIILIPVAIIGVMTMSPGSVTGSAAEAAKFRELSRSALDSAEGKTDLAKLNAMKDAELLQELKARQAALNGIDPGGKGDTDAARAAWGALLRANSVNADRQRRAGKGNDD